MQLQTITKRFIDIVKALEDIGKVKSRSALAEYLGTHRQSFNEILLGKRNVTVELIQKICESYNANPSYLMLGHHPLFINPESQTKPNLQHVPIKAQAGYGGQITNTVFENQLERYRIPGKLFDDVEYRSFEIEGDSMEPCYKDKDQVICSFIPAVYYDRVLKPEQAYIIITQESVLLKRIKHKPETKKDLILVSDNTYYEDKSVALAEILEIWKVEGLITKREIKPHNISNK